MQTEVQQLSTKVNIINEKPKKSTHTSLFSEISDHYDLNEKADVDELIDQMYAKGCRPIVSVDKSKAESIQKDGLKPNVSWVKEMGKIIVGTFGIKPYHPEGQERAYFLLNVPQEKISARYTGRNSSFNGVVYLGSDMISADMLQPLSANENAHYKQQQQMVNHERKEISQLQL